MSISITDKIKFLKVSDENDESSRDTSKMITQERYGLRMIGDAGDGFAVDIVFRNYFEANICFVRLLSAEFRDV